MLRSSLILVVLALLALLFADLEVTTLSAWSELGEIALGAVQPDFSVLWKFKSAFLNTVIFAFAGTSLAAFWGFFLALGFGWAPVRLLCAFIRSVHEIFWAFIFLNLVGLNPICGVLSIAIPYSGIFAKVYAEIAQESDRRPLVGIPPRADGFSSFIYAVLPVVYTDAKLYTGYRFECALRSSTILGFIGLPTIGYHLETAFREGIYNHAWALLYAFYLLIAALKYWARPKLIIPYIVISFTFLSQKISISWANMIRFLTVDIMPWPLRRVDPISGNQEINFSVTEILSWLINTWHDAGAEGVWNTILLTQIVLATTGIFTLLAFPFACRNLSYRPIKPITRFLLIVCRTTPEYILAYVFILIYGPSMLPAILAITLHNGAILSFLTSNNADLIKLRSDAPKRHFDRYTYLVLPRVYGQFLAFLFYRWEIIMRESAILGVLGIYTLGFYIDSAIAEDQLDKAILLILITATLNIIIDSISQQVRKRLKISTRFVVASNQIFSTQ